MAVADRALVVGNDARHMLTGIDGAVGYGEVTDGAANVQPAEGSCRVVVRCVDGDAADGVALSVEAYPIVVFAVHVERLAAEVEVGAQVDVHIVVAIGVVLLRGGGYVPVVLGVDDIRVGTCAAARNRRPGRRGREQHHEQHHRRP